MVHLPKPMEAGIVVAVMAEDMVIHLAEEEDSLPGGRLSFQSRLRCTPKA